MDPDNNNTSKMKTEGTNPLKTKVPKDCYKASCPVTMAEKIEICKLLGRLERAENDLTSATHILKHLSTLKNIGEKISAMEPYPQQSEGHEMRYTFWDMERRLAKLSNYYRRETMKSMRLRSLVLSQKKVTKEKSEDCRKSDGKNSKPQSNTADNTYTLLVSQASVVSFKLEVDDDDDEEKRPESPPEVDPATIHKCGQDIVRSPSTCIFGGDIIMRDLIRGIRGKIFQAREKFGDTQNTLFHLSKIFTLVREYVSLDSLCRCSKDVENMKSALNALTGGQYEGGGDVDYVHNERLRTSERAITDYDSRIKKIGDVNSRINRFKKHVKEVDDNLAIMFGRLDAGLPLRCGIIDNPTKINKLFKTIRILESNIKDVSRIPIQLQESEIQRDATVDAIEEYVELLGIIKLDRADLERAFDEKVATEELDKKVHEAELKNKKTAFHNIIDQNMELFTSRDEERQKVAKSVKELLNSKISSDQFADFQKFLDKYLKRITKDVQETPPARHQMEATVTRKGLSDNYLCCRCAAKMKGIVPKKTSGLTPYHAYEIQTLQRRQLKLFGIKNPNLLRKDVQQKPESRGSQRPEKKEGSSRHCGGHHTTTTPQQRHLRVIPCEEQPLCHPHAVPAQNKIMLRFKCNDLTAQYEPNQ